MRPAPAGYDLRALGLGARLSSIRGGEVLAVNIPASDVLVEWTTDREVSGKLSFTAPREWLPADPYAPLANFGQRIVANALVEVGGAEHEIPLGVFLITTWTEEEDGVSVEAYDLMQVLADNPMPFPSSPPPGATLLGELRRLCEGLPVVLDMDDMPVSRDIQYGFDRAEAVSDLSAACGVTYRVMPDGYLHVFKPTGANPVAIYTASDVLVGAFKTAPKRRANRVLVVGAEESKAHAVVNVDFPPFDQPGYGLVVERVENPAATSDAQARVVAESIAKDIGKVTRKRTVQIAADPLLEGGDVVTVLVGDETLVGRVVAYSLPLSDPSDLMRVDLEVLEW